MSSRSRAYHACYVLFCKGLAENIDAMGKVQKMYKLPESFGWISAAATVNALERLGVFSFSNPAGLVELSERLEMRETHKKIKKIVKKNYEKIPKFLFTSYSELHHSADLKGLVKQTHEIIKKLCAQVELVETIVETRTMGRKCGPETQGLLENFNQAHDKVKELDCYVTQAVRMLQLEEQEGAKSYPSVLPHKPKTMITPSTIASSEHPLIDFDDKPPVPLCNTKSTSASSTLPNFGSNDQPLIEYKPPVPPRSQKTKSMPSMTLSLPQPQDQVTDRVAEMKVSRNSIFEEYSSHMPIKLLQELATSRDVIKLSERPQMALPSETDAKQDRLKRISAPEVEVGQRSIPRERKSTVKKSHYTPMDAPGMEQKPRRTDSDLQLPVTYENCQPKTYPQHKDPFILEEYDVFEFEYESSGSDDMPEDEYIDAF